MTVTCLYCSNTILSYLKGSSTDFTQEDQLVPSPQSYLSLGWEPANLQQKVKLKGVKLPDNGGETKDLHLSCIMGENATQMHLNELFIKLQNTKTHK